MATQTTRDAQISGMLSTMLLFAKSGRSGYNMKIAMKKTRTSSNTWFCPGMHPSITDPTGRSETIAMPICSARMCLDTLVFKILNGKRMPGLNFPSNGMLKLLGHLGQSSHILLLTVSPGLRGSIPDCADYVQSSKYGYKRIWGFANTRSSALRQHDKVSSRVTSCGIV